jgi:hypothetical protein
MFQNHPGVELRANILELISHRFHLFEVAFAWELTKETMHLPLGCLQGSVGAGTEEAVLSRIVAFLLALFR